MKVALSLSIIGGAAALASKQHPFRLPDQIPQAAQNTWSDQIHKINDLVGGLTEEAQAAWDDVARMYPEEMAKLQANVLPRPKSHTRRPDHEWDHIVRGQDVQAAQVEEDQGDLDRELHTYDMRVKKVDPSILQVDPGVKQYSGYLDDNANDKHLFYCEQFGV